MKILYLGSISTSDSDFPLINELEHQGQDVRYYVPISKQMCCAGTIEIKKVKNKTSIIPFYEYVEMQPYKDYLNLEKSFFINQIDFRARDIRTILIWIKLYFVILLWKPDVLHFSWPQSKFRKLLYFLPFKKVLTVHDPFKHSSNKSKKEEKDRIYAFNKVDEIVLLNDVQKNDFCQFYQIESSKVHVNKMGNFNYFNQIEPSFLTTSSNFILYFGYISGYKGLEFLCEAMVKVHETHPNTKLVIAGGGKIYFDYSKYKQMEYIELYNRYISIPELSGLLKKCLFSVCPYRDATQSGVVQTSFSVNVPVIVTNVGALPSVVEHQKTGMVVEKENVDALAEAMNLLLDSQLLLKTMRLNIQEYWQPKMNWAPIAQQYLKIYKNIN